MSLTLVKAALLLSHSTTGGNEALSLTEGRLQAHGHRLGEKLMVRQVALAGNRASEPA